MSASFSEREGTGPTHAPEAAEKTAPRGHRRFRRRMATFASLVLTFLLLVDAFVCATFCSFLEPGTWLGCFAATGSLIAAFLATTILGFRISNPPLRFVYTLAAAWIGTLNFAFFAAVACWVLVGINGLAGMPVPATLIAAGCLTLGLLVAGYGLINAAWIRVTRISVALPNLPAAWQGRAVALVSDLHLGHVSGPGFLRRVLAKLRSVEPEAVLISGDMFDGSPLGLDRLVAPWKEFRPPRGVYFVTGNHDEFADRGIYLKAVAATGIQVLNNEKVAVEGLELIGVHDAEATDAEALRAILQRVGVDPARPSILLAHQPACLAVAEEAGVSLQLSGHTHRGQVWPWNYLVRRIYGRFGYGLQRRDRLQVYTSSGVGMWGPPLRVATFPEIVLIRLERA